MKQAVDIAPAGTPASLPLVKPLFLFMALSVFYALFHVTNTIEAYDAPQYVMIATSSALSETMDTRNILFHKVNGILWRASQNLGLGIDCDTLLSGFTILCAAGGVVLFERWLRRGLALSPAASCLGAIMLATCYGYWRYANEVEVYAPSILLILLTLNVLSVALAPAPEQQIDAALAPAPEQQIDAALAPASEQQIDVALAPASEQHETISGKNAHRLALTFLAGVIGGAGVLFYQANGTALVLAMPLLFFFGRERGRNFVPFVVYGLGGSLVSLTGLVLAFHFDGGQELTPAALFDFINRRGGEFPGESSMLRALAKAAIVTLHDIVSLNWIYGIPAVESLIRKVAPSHYDWRSKELFFAAQAYGSWCYVAALTFAVMIAAWMRLALAAWRNTSHGGPHSPSAAMAFLLAWIVINSAVNLKLDPGSREVWLTMLPALVAVAAVYVIAPALSNGGRRYVMIFLLALTIHNWIGGFALFRNPEGDYTALLSAGLRKSVRAGDALIVSEVSHTPLELMRTLKLQLALVNDRESAIANVDPRKNVPVPLDQLTARLLNSGARLFVIEPLLLAPGPNGTSPLTNHAIIKSLLANARRIDTGPLGATYEIVK